jgi:hypothetical protein
MDEHKALEIQTEPHPDGGVAVTVTIRLQRPDPASGERACPTCGGACFILSDDGKTILACNTCAGYLPDKGGTLQWGAWGVVTGCRHCGGPVALRRECGCEGARAERSATWAERAREQWAKREPVPWAEAGDVCCGDDRYDSVREALADVWDQWYGEDREPAELLGVELAPVLPVAFPDAADLADGVCERVSEHVNVEDWYVSERARADLVRRLTEWVSEYGSEAEGCWNEDGRRRIDLTGCPVEELTGDCDPDDGPDRGGADGDHASALESAYGPEE